MNPESKMKIRREGDVLGEWDRFEIRSYLASGSLLISDQVYIEEEDKWVSLIPTYRRKWNLFDWSDEDDELWYFIKEGYIHGPRHISEIDALHIAGYLTEDVLITSVGQDDWVTIADLIAEGSTDSLEVSAKDHASDALDRLLDGDKFGAGVSGFKAIGSMWKKFTTIEPLTSEWLCIPESTDGLPPEEVIKHIIIKEGVEPVNMEWLTKDDERILGLQFASIEEATTAKELFSAKKHGDGWQFSFSGLNIESTK